VDYGVWEGMTAREAEMYDPSAFLQYRRSPSEAICPSGERLSDAQRRMMEALDLIAHRHGGETVAAVTHAVMIRLAVAELEGIDGEEWRIPLGRGSVTRFEITPDGIRVAALPDGDDVD
jgi:broad specificity phosphatase PhoE